MILQVLLNITNLTFLLSYHITKQKNTHIAECCNMGVYHC